MTAASIYGTEDGGVAEIEAAVERLPAETAWTSIVRGNHAQCGWYGRQSGDGQASMSRADQQAQFVEATAKSLMALADRMQ